VAGVQPKSRMQGEIITTPPSINGRGGNAPANISVSRCSTSRQGLVVASSIPDARRRPAHGFQWLKIQT
jgi:hypothetical protein